MKQPYQVSDSTSTHFSAARNLELFIGLLATFLIAVGILFYAFDEPDRIVLAQQAQLEVDLDDAMSLYAQNCSICHGLAGEGIGSTPPLNNPDLQTADSQALIKIISRGLYGTAMPAWSVEDGGPLSTYQISELVMLIQEGDWQNTQDRVVNLGLAPLVPFTTQADPLILEKVKNLPEGDLLTQGVTLYAQECVACHGADGLGSRLAPALNDPQVRTKSEAELLRTIQNGVAGTLMASWKNTLGDDQLAALLALITRWDEIPSGAIPAPDQPIPVTEESLTMGANLFSQSCARCHGPEGQGTQRAPSLNVKSYLADNNDAALQQIITFGVTGTSMPAWGDRLSEAEIQALVGFIRSWEPTAPEVAVPARSGGGPWWSTSGTQSGQQVLPSGGQPRGGKGRGGPANGKGSAGRNAGLTQDVVTTEAPPPDAQNQLATLQTPQVSDSSYPGLSDQRTINDVHTSALQTTARGAGVSGTSQTEPYNTSLSTANHNPAGSGPAWAQAPAQTDGWLTINWLIDNWRTAGLILGVFTIGLTLVGTAVYGLHRRVRID